MINIFKKIISFFLLYCPFEGYSFLFPENGSTIYQTQVMFTIDEFPLCDAYLFELYENRLNEKSTVAPIVTFQTKSLCYLLNKHLEFGKNYKWRYKAFKNKLTMYESPFYYFQIASSNRSDTTLFKIKVNSNSINHLSNEIIFVDHLAGAIDKQGKLKWFLPCIDDSLHLYNFRDLQLTPTNSVTYLNYFGAYEKTLTNKLNWQLSNYDTTTQQYLSIYHHELEKHRDGSYWVGGSQYQGDVRFNTLEQYSKSTLLWRWSELNAKEKDSIFKSYHFLTTGGHLNGFAFDKQNIDFVWLSFKNLNNVFKLNKKTKTIEAALQVNNGEFMLQQHGPFITQQSTILLYNNNITDTEKENQNISYPSIINLSKDNDKTLILKNLLIQSDSFPDGIKGKEGYCMQSSNGNYLVTLGGANASFEFNSKYEKIWECFFYKRKSTTSPWQIFSNYRTQQNSSLYPRFFTVQSKLYLPNKTTTKLKINNEGTDDDSYELISVSSKGIEKILATNLFIKAAHSKVISIPNHQLKNITSLYIKPVLVKGIDFKVHL